MDDISEFLGNYNQKEMLY